MNVDLFRYDIRRKMIKVWFLWEKHKIILLKTRQYGKAEDIILKRVICLRLNSWSSVQKWYNF
jgi:hypothetical protein